jgi:hypothetical protein
METYLDLLRTVRDLDLIENVAPIQLAIRLLIPAGSRLLELHEVQEFIGPFNAAALFYPWKHPDPWLDALCDEIQEVVAASEKSKRSRQAIFERIWAAARETAGQEAPRPALPALLRAAIPYLNEPWYC